MWEKSKQKSFPACRESTVQIDLDKNTCDKSEWSVYQTVNVFSLKNEFLTVAFNLEECGKSTLCELPQHSTCVMLEQLTILFHHATDEAQYRQIHPCWRDLATEIRGSSVCRPWILNKIVLLLLGTQSLHKNPANFSFLMSFATRGSQQHLFSCKTWAAGLCPPASSCAHGWVLATQDHVRNQCVELGGDRDRKVIPEHQVPRPVSLSVQWQVTMSCSSIS